MKIAVQRTTNVPLQEQTNVVVIEVLATIPAELQSHGLVVSFLVQDSRPAIHHQVGGQGRAVVFQPRKEMENRGQAPKRLESPVLTMERGLGLLQQALGRPPRSPSLKAVALVEPESLK
jgi:hypothetical protein